MRTSSLPAFSLRRPVTTLMVFFSFLLLGGVAASRIPLQLLPDGFNPPFMWIWIPYANSSPTEVEDKITRPVEESLRTLKNLGGIWSTSRSDAAVVRMRFDSNTDMGLAYAEARDRVERVKPTLPEDVREVYLQRANPNDEAVYILGVQFDGYVEDPYYLLKNGLGQKILRLPGIAKVDVGGADEKVIQVELDMDRVKAHQVNLYELTRRLRSDNFTLASGHVDEGNRRYLVRSVARYPTIESIAGLPVRGDGLKVSDIAKVTYGVPEITRHFRIDGKPSYVLEIFKESASNTVEVCRRIDEEVDRLSLQYPGVRLIKFDDDAKYITESLGLLLNNGVVGGLLAAFLLFYFLRRVRITLLITLAIPLALLITIVVMYFAGQSLNIISMMGLMLSVGMLVDNSVVVVENMTRVMTEEGRTAREAAVRGAGEVSLAILMSTLTTMVVFLPSVLLTQDGMMRFFMGQLAIPICISLAASLLVSLLFIPLWSSIVLKDAREPGALLKACDRVYERTLGWANRRYVDLLALTLHHRSAALTLLALVVVVTVAVPFQRVHMTEEDNGSGRNIWVGFNFPGAFTLEDSDAFMRKVEAKVESLRDKYDIKHYRIWASKTRGNIRVLLKDMSESDLEVPWVAEHLVKELPTQPGVTQFTNWSQSLSSGEADMRIYLLADDTGQLLDTSPEVVRRLKLIPDVVAVDTDLEEGNDEVRLQLDREALQQYDVSPEVLSSLVAYAVRGYPLPKYRYEGKDVEVRIQVQKSDRENLDQIRDLAVPTRGGGTVPLASVATFQVRRALQEISRFNGRTALGLKISTTLKDKKELEKRVMGVVNSMQLPQGMTVSTSNLLGRGGNAGQDFAAGLALSICFVFLLMGVLFESFMLPFVVITSIPLAFAGSWWLLYAMGSELNIMAVIGTILLAGVVVNNAIVLVDRVNQLRKEGSDREEALLEAARQRFRPILMTALTTILGLLPMAFGKAAFVGIPYSPMGLTFVGGLTAGTFLTLLVVPLFYQIFDGWRESLSVRFTRVARTWGPARWARARSAEEGP
ncbi:MAG: efflux RND transporter permease subunit [Acidobacteriota bacterium]